MMELGEFELAAAVRCLHHDDLRLHVIEADDVPHPVALDSTCFLAVEPQVEEERGCGLEVVDDDVCMIENSLHP